MHPSARPYIVVVVVVVVIIVVMSKLSKYMVEIVSTPSVQGQA